MNAAPTTRKLPRAMENGHILLWLIKDTCWAMEAKVMATIMIFPTIGMALYLLWNARKTPGDAVHNLAVCLWIGANTTWMLGEFRGKDWRPYAVVIFITGLVVLAVYYLLIFPKERTRYEYLMVEKEALNDSPASGPQARQSV